MFLQVEAFGFLQVEAFSRWAGRPRSPGADKGPSPPPGFCVSGERYTREGSMSGGEFREPAVKSRESSRRILASTSSRTPQTLSPGCIPESGRLESQEIPFARGRCAGSLGRSSYRSPGGWSRSGRRTRGRRRWTWGQSARLECLECRECRECLEWLECLECLECLEWLECLLCLVCLECPDYLEADLRPLDAAVELSADLRAGRRLRLGVEPQVVDRFQCQFVSPAVWTINLHRGNSLQCRGSTAKEALGFPCRAHVCFASVPGKSTARRSPPRSHGTSSPRGRKRRASRASDAGSAA